jgi:hypothetical protein
MNSIKVKPNTLVLKYEDRDEVWVKNNTSLYNKNTFIMYNGYSYILNVSN